MRKTLTVAVLAAFAIVGGTVQADLNFTVDPGAAQFAYVNAFNISDDLPAAGFGYDPVLSPSTFVGNTQVLGPNTDIYTANGGGTGGEDTFWFTGDGSGTQLKYVEVSTYQESGGVAVGTVVNFDFLTVADTLAAQGYTGEAFIKVLDPLAGWATIDNERVDLAAGLGGLTWTTTVAGTVQAGFAVTGLYVDPTTAAGLGTFEVIPEPATLGLLGIFGGGLLFFRRCFKS